jgi:hypothetical protein
MELRTVCRLAVLGEELKIYLQANELIPFFLGLNELQLLEKPSSASPLPTRPTGRGSYLDYSDLLM